MTNNSPTPIAMTFSTKERYSKHLSFLDCVLLLIKLFAASFFVQYAISEMMVENTSWAFAIYLLVIAGYAVINAWQDFKSSYIFCFCLNNNAEPAQAEIELAFDDKEEYKMFRTFVGSKIDTGLAQIITDSGLMQENEARSSINVDIADIRYRNKTQRAIVRVWGAVKTAGAMR